MINFKRAFTLVELLVVIAIIGLLAGVVMISVNSARRKSRDAVRKSNIANLSLAIEQYYDDQTPPAYPAVATWTTDIASYMEQGVVPTDPSTGANYTYGLDANNDYYICATIEKDSSSFCKGPGTAP